MIMVMIVLVIFSKRFFDLNLKTYYAISLSIVLVIGLIIIFSTFLYGFQITDDGGWIDGFNNVFNSQGGRNFLSVTLLILS